MTLLLDIRSASVPMYVCIYFYIHHTAVGHILHELRANGPVSLHLQSGTLLMITYIKEVFQERINQIREGLLVSEAELKQFLSLSSVL